MKKILIFGAGGFVGRYLAEEFSKNGYETVCSDMLQTLPFSARYEQVELTDGAQVQALIAREQPSVIVNLAGISSVGLSWSIPQTTVQVNVVGALNILEAVKKEVPACRVLLVGSSEEYAQSDLPISERTPLDASNPYGISKATQERFAELYRKDFGMKVYCVRPFNHTGVGQRDSFVLPSFCKQVAEIEKSGKSGTLSVGNLAVKRDFSHVKDIVRAYRMIVEQDDCNQIYNVGSGKAYSLKELLEYIISLSGQKISVEVDEKRLRPNDIPVICCDNRAITRDLGWKANYTVFDALHEMYEYYLK